MSFQIHWNLSIRVKLNAFRVFGLLPHFPIVLFKMMDLKKEPRDFGYLHSFDELYFLLTLTLASEKLYTF